MQTNHTRPVDRDGDTDKEGRETILVQGTRCIAYVACTARQLSDHSPGSLFAVALAS